MQRQILMNCLSSRSGGAVSYLRHVIDPLRAALGSRDTGLVLLLRGDQQRQLVTADDRATVIPDGEVAGVRRALWERRRLAALAAERGCGLIFTPYQIATLVPDVVNVVMLRNMEPFFSREYPYTLRSRARNELLRWQTRHCLKEAEATIAVSEFAGDYARERLGTPPDRITRIYHGRDEAFSPAVNGDDSTQLRTLGVRKPYLFTCGSLLPYRRVEDVIAAFDDLARQDLEQAQLVIAGSGSDSAYQALVSAAIAKSANRERIVFLGHVSITAMRTLYRHARVFVTATEVEACPNIAIEALSSGCATVAADTPALRELLGDTGSFYPQRDLDALGTQLNRLWRSEPERQSLAAAALRRATDFSWPRCAAETAALLGRLLERGAGSATCAA